LKTDLNEAIFSHQRSFGAGQLFLPKAKYDPAVIVLFGIELFETDPLEIDPLDRGLFFD
jgi:hypothetical protein